MVIIHWQQKRSQRAYPVGATVRGILTQMALLHRLGFHVLRAKGKIHGSSFWFEFIVFSIVHHLVRVISLDLDIILCLGTTQLVSSPEPERNLSVQLGNDTSCVVSV